MGVRDEFLIHVLLRIGIRLHGRSHAQKERKNDAFSRSFSDVGVLFTDVELIS